MVIESVFLVTEGGEEIPLTQYSIRSSGMAYPEVNISFEGTLHEKGAIAFAKLINRTEDENIPVEIIYQEDKMITILIFPDGERVISQPTDEDKACYSREIGFLEALGKRIYGTRSALVRAIESGKVQKVK